MSVRIDDAREDVQAARFDLIEGLAVSWLDDRIEDTARDQDIRLANAVLGDNASAADREICGGRP